MWVSPRRGVKADCEHIFSSAGFCTLWLLEHFFAEKRNGVYVELGAVDGVRFSNTLALHTCRDWTGVLVEANRANYHLLRVNAPKYRGARKSF